MAGKMKKGGGSRKIDRNRDWCKAYRNRNQREKNKIKKITKHLLTHVGDKHAETTLKLLRITVKGH